MRDFEIITYGTPIIKANKYNDAIAYDGNKKRIYHKEFDITEFIGEELAKIRSIPSVHYFPVVFGKKSRVLGDTPLERKCNNIRVGSFDFKDDASINYVHVDSEYIPEMWLQYILDCKDNNNRVEFIIEHLEMYALDIYMGQHDRRRNVVYEIWADGQIHLGKLFDYEFSLSPEIFSFTFPDSYTTPYHTFLRVDDYKKFIEQYQPFEEMLKSYLDVDLVATIVKMAEEREFDLKHFDLDPYKEFDEKSHKRLERILK